MKKVKKNCVSFEEQTKRAKNILESEVRPQVRIYEKNKIKEASNDEVSLSHSQRAHLSCQSPI